jgi:uncharacterized protein YodC (DUF2158 family)
MTKFDPGQVVQLRSGEGPRLVVVRAVGDDVVDGEAWCRWFDAKGHLQLERIETESLVDADLAAQLGAGPR